MEDHGRQQEANALGTSINCSGQPTSLAGQMEAQVELQQVVIDVAGHFTNGLLGDAGEDGVSHLLEDGGTNASCTIRYDHGACHSPGSPASCSEINVHGVDNALEVEGDLHIEQLGTNEQRNSCANTQSCA